MFAASYSFFPVLLPLPRSSKRRRRRPTLVLLPDKSHGQRSLVVHGVARSQTQLSDFIFTFHFHASEKEMATHSSILAWRIPGMGEPGGLPSMGSHRVGHDWSDLAAAAAGHWRLCDIYGSSFSGSSPIGNWTAFYSNSVVLYSWLVILLQRFSSPEPTLAWNGTESCDF